MKVFNVWGYLLLLVSPFLIAEPLSLGPRAFNHSMDIYLKDDFSSGFKQQLSASQKKWLANQRVVKVGVVGPLTPPFGFINSKVYFEGMAADLLSILSIATDVKLSLHYYDSQSEALAAIEKGEVDILSINSILPESVPTLTDYGWLSHEIIDSGHTYLIGLVDKDLSDLKKVTLAYERDAFYPATLKNQFPDAKILAYDNVYLAYDAVLFGDADFFVSNRLVSHYLNGSRLGNMILQQKLVINNKPMSFLVGRNHPELLSIIDSFVTVFRRSYLYNVLSLRWHGGVDAEPLVISNLIESENYAELLKRKIRVALIKDNMPFSFIDDKGEWQGIIIDVLQHISLLTNLKFIEIAYSRFDEAEIGLLRHEVDVIGSIPDHSSRTDLLTSLSYNTNDVLVIIEARVHVSPNKQVYAVSDSNYEEVKKSTLGQSKKNNFLFFDNDLDVIRQLEAGKVNHAIVSMYSAEYYSKISSRSFHIVKRLNNENIERVFAVRNSDYDLMALIDGALLNSPPSYLSNLAYQWRYGPKPKVSFYAQYGHIIKPVLLVLGPILVMYLYYSYRLATALRFRKKAEGKLLSQLDMMQRFLDGIPHSVVLLESDLTIIYCNKAFYDEFGENEVFNKHLSHFVTKKDELDAVFVGVSTAIEAFEVVGRDSFVTIAGRQKEIQEWFIPYKDMDTGSVGGFWGWFDVTWRNEAYATILSAKNQAEMANQAKTEFIAMISHEIRTPINIISGFLELFYKTKMLTGSEREELEYIRSAVNGLLELVGDVLDVTKIESGLLTLDLKPTDIVKILNDATEVFYVVSQDKGIYIRKNYNIASSCWLILDPLRVRQIFYNVLSNAVKFTNRGGIIINVNIIDNILQVSVTDSGVGISANKIGNLFQPFKQAHIDNNYQGSGLGLNISKRLCELMAGSISIESTLGVGTTVQFELPCQWAPKNTINPILASDYQSILPPENFSAFRILIVDDHPVNLILLEKQLCLIGFTVIKAFSGQQVLDLIEVEHVDVILTDCQMPKIDGYELSSKIREYEQRSDSKKHIILGLTASGLKRDRVKAINSGMDECFFKPIDTVGLQKALSQYLMNLRFKVAPYEENCTQDETLFALVRETCMQDINLSYEALELSDLNELSSLVHRIKGVYLMVKQSNIVSLCRSIEHELTGNKNLKLIHQRLSEIESIINKC